MTKESHSLRAASHQAGLPVLAREAVAESAPLTRRGFIAKVIGTTGLLTTGSFPCAVAGQRGRILPPRPRRPVPPLFHATDLTLRAAPSTVHIGEDKITPALTYNGFLPGPTLRVRQGETAHINFVNQLSQETTIHWHGMVVPPAVDGHPADAIAPGGNYVYSFPVQQRACLNWYHPHPHMLTGQQVCLGLAGAFIVNDAEEDALNLPKGNHEIPLIVRDATLDSTGKLTYTMVHTGYLGQFPLVNGKINPVFDVNAAIYRLRVLNGANARVFRLALSSGDAFIVIGNDGGLLESATEVQEIEIGPGERLDLLINLRRKSTGTTAILKCLNTGWNLAQFFVRQTFDPGGFLPGGILSHITPLSNPVATRLFNFEGNSRINGNLFDMDRIDFQVPFGQTERWRFVNVGNGGPHPVHVHGASFQVQSRTGGRGVIYAWERGWKDTVLVKTGETVEVLIRFEGYRGRYMIHCHNLEHEDMGMMSNFEVV